MLILTILTDNRQNPSERVFALSDHGVVRLQGADAIPFAQAQFSNDLNALEDGRWQWNAWLTPKGRVIAVFALLRIAHDQLLMVVPDTPAAELATALKRFVFRKKVTIEVPPDLSVSAAFVKPTRAQGALIDLDPTDEVTLDLGTAQEPRTLHIGPRAGEQGPAELGRWRDIDLRHGLIRLDASQREQWTPQQLSLERLRAFSVKKGCYPGQEIVARTHFLGKAKRGLVLFECDALLQPGAPVEQADRPLGQIVGSSTHAPGLALAVLPLDHSAEAVHSHGTPLRIAPLLDGLAR